MAGTHTGLDCLTEPKRHRTARPEQIAKVGGGAYTGSAGKIFIYRNPGS